LKFSVITASYNSDKTLFKNILSVTNQTYKNVEHIFVDNQSSDNTLGIISEFSKRDTTVVSKKDKGMYFALNEGIDLAKGDIVGILNSDDKFASSNVLEKVSDTFRKFDCDLIWGNVNIIKKDSDNIHRIYNGKFNPNKGFEYGIMPPHPSVFIKKKIYEKYGRFNTSYDIASDYDLMLRFIKSKDINCKYLDKCIVEMKTGGKSSSSIISFIKLNNEIRIINENYSIDYNFLKFFVKVVIRMTERINQGQIRDLIIHKYFKILKEHYE
jgi:glycosyltransferase involved in cell wall biosynthesis